MTHDDIAELLTGVLKALDLELDRLEITKAGKRRVVRVTIDGDGPNHAGPDMDQVAQATRAVSKVLDDAGAMGESPYTLEVGTRGVTTPLSRPAHYARRIGRLVRITTTEGVITTGRVSSADETSVTIEVNQLPVVLDFTEIAEAIVQVEMNRHIDDDIEERDE
ncbi:hypothetical protein HMPREF1531_02388 [Propionibacterium sp. oral taxon 192 str. F0372]|uniref:ribosome maturation factor RimP n=1 Tax=Propionibacterium sp. oral taxon 192 TaxID=671222 RepID=UPI0003532235|nr:ribosome maturation factor RimP [Propionibacterium sp. oral taxon 192]EPH00280.1 hypothetical protein HMPREF1531_02388 [Propionibacterium sp. oral taxon 192 str. F0372]